MTEHDTGYEVVDEVQADVVEIRQGGAGVVQANTVSVTQGGIQTASTEVLSITQGGVGIVETDDATIQMGGAIYVSADSVSFDTAGAILAVADTVHAENTTIGVLFAGSIEGNPDIRVDGRTTAIVGGAVLVALVIVRRFLRR